MRITLCVVACLFATALFPPGHLAGTQEPAAPTVGWYNGDWQSGIPGLLNWYVSKREFARVYDDFVVPDGGWTVVGVFSNNVLYHFPDVTQASWEIRRAMAYGKAGKLVASGLDSAVQRPASNNRLPEGVHVRIEVDGLHVPLTPGRYWLSVTPLGRGHSYICATRGRNASGNPPGNNGWALFDVQPGPRRFRETLDAAAGEVGIGIDFSQGVIISPVQPVPVPSPGR
ncbi:MAG TPA: hypothetical protein VLY04_18020 [Bryobacteraceae bacterium]|nr:hypothetical protein [Bryobacteraceae bacterium]